MRTKLGILLCACTLAACDGGSSTPPSLPGHEGGRGDGAMPAVDAGPPVTVNGQVYGDGSSGSGGPVAIAGATVHVLGTTNQTTADASGNYTLMVPSGATVFLEASASGYEPAEVGLVVPASGAAVNIHEISQAQVSMVETQLGFSQNGSNGIVIVVFNATYTGGGFGATLSASHGSSFAFNMGNPQYSSTTFPGGMNQQLVFPNTTPGTTTVTPQPPSGHTCALDQAITNYRVDPGVFTWVLADCT